MIDTAFAKRLFKNPAFGCGFVLLVVGTGPLVVLIMLDAIGAVDAGSGLGFGLLMWATLPPALVLLVIGLEKVARQPPGR